MTIGLLIFIGILFAAVLSVVAIGQSKKADLAWQEASKRLKLRYHKSGSFGKRDLTGKVDNFTTHVETTKEKKGQASSRHTVYKVRWQKRRHGFGLTRSSAMSGVASFFGSQDIEVGSVEFDRAVIVKSDHPADIKKLMTPVRQQQVMRVLLSYPGAVIKNGSVTWKQKGVCTNATQLEGVIRRFVRLAQAMASDRVVESEDTAPDVMLDSRDYREEVKRSGWEWQRGKVDREEEEPEPKPKDGASIHRLAPVDLKKDVRSALGTVALSAATGAPEPAVVAPERPEPIIDVPDEPVVHASPIESHEEVEVPELESEPALIPTVIPIPFEAMPEPVALEPEPEPDAPAPGAAEDLSVADVGEDLFLGNQLGMDVTKKFDEHYRDCEVRWTGKLDRVDSYFSDFVFGSTPGTKALVEVYELQGGTYGSTTVHAVVQLSVEEGASLRTRAGESISFTGRLAGCEPFMRNILVAHGQLV